MKYGYIFDQMRDNIHKDKKRLCLVLYLTNEVILNWHNKIIEMFAPQLAITIGAENRTLTEEELLSLVQFIQRREFEPLFTDISGLLYQVEDNYRHKGERHLAEQIDNISKQLHSFCQNATDRKAVGSYAP